MENKSIFTSKTFLLALAHAIFGVLATTLASDPNINTLGWMALLKSVVDIGLRLMTKDSTHIV